MALLTHAKWKHVALVFISVGLVLLFISSYLSEREPQINSSIEHTYDTLMRKLEPLVERSKEQKLRITHFNRNVYGRLTRLKVVNVFDGHALDLDRRNTWLGYDYDFRYGRKDDMKSCDDGLIEAAMQNLARTPKFWKMPSGNTHETTDTSTRRDRDIVYGTSTDQGVIQFVKFRVEGGTGRLLTIRFHE